MPAADFAALDRAGLNLQAVFDIDTLPDPLQDHLRSHPAFEPIFRQLLLIGHGGRLLWEKVQGLTSASEHPIDDYSRDTFTHWFATGLPGHNYSLLYPGDTPVGLQTLGALAGWHHATPFMVGINARWGSWFAYRVLALADTELPVTAPLTAPSPCLTCAAQPCITVCPAEAMAQGRFSLDRCIAYRRQADSRCRTTCIARLACPVNQECRYEDSQLRHAYGCSLANFDASSD